MHECKHPTELEIDLNLVEHIDHKKSDQFSYAQLVTFLPPPPRALLYTVAREDTLLDGVPITNTMTNSWQHWHFPIFWNILWRNDFVFWEAINIYLFFDKLVDLTFWRRYLGELLWRNFNICKLLFSTCTHKFLVVTIFRRLSIYTFFV